VELRRVDAAVRLVEDELPVLLDADHRLRERPSAAVRGGSGRTGGKRKEQDPGG
jgi:hypothetical protein